MRVMAAVLVAGMMAACGGGSGSPAAEGRRSTTTVGPIPLPAPRGEPPGTGAGTTARPESAAPTAPAPGPAGPGTAPPAGAPGPGTAPPAGAEGQVRGLVTRDCMADAVSGGECAGAAGGEGGAGGVAVELRSGDGRTVLTTTRTSPTGEFSFSASPGHYLVREPVTGTSRELDVVAGQTTSVAIALPPTSN